MALFLSDGNNQGTNIDINGVITWKLFSDFVPHDVKKPVKPCKN